MASVLRLPDDEGDRRRGPGNVPRPLPDLRQLDQLRAIRDDNKVPWLPVARGRGPPTGVKDALKVRPGNRLVGVLAHVATRADGVPGLHVLVVRLHAGPGSAVAGGAHRIAAGRPHPNRLSLPTASEPDVREPFPCGLSLLLLGTGIVAWVLR